MTKTDKSHEADSNVQLPQWWHLDWYPICSMNVVWGKSLFPTWIVKFTVYEFCFFIHFCIQLYLYLNQTEECPNGEISVQGQPLLVKHRFCIFWISCRLSHVTTGYMANNLAYHSVEPVSPSTTISSYIYRKAARGPVWRLLHLSTLHLLLVTVSASLTDKCVWNACVLSPSKIHQHATIRSLQSGCIPAGLEMMAQKYCMVIRTITSCWIVRLHFNITMYLRHCKFDVLQKSHEKIFCLDSLTPCWIDF